MEELNVQTKDSLACKKRRKENAQTEWVGSLPLELWEVAAERAGDNCKFNLSLCITEGGACSCGTVAHADCTAIEEEIQREQDGRNATGWLDERTPRWIEYQTTKMYRTFSF